MWQGSENTQLTASCCHLHPVVISTDALRKKEQQTRLHMKSAILQAALSRIWVRAIIILLPTIYFSGLKILNHIILCLLSARLARGQVTSLHLFALHFMRGFKRMRCNHTKPVQVCHLILSYYQVKHGCTKGNAVLCWQARCAWTELLDCQFQNKWSKSIQNAQRYQLFLIPPQNLIPMLPTMLPSHRATSLEAVHRIACSFTHQCVRVCGVKGTRFVPTKRKGFGYSRYKPSVNHNASL